MTSARSQFAAALFAFACFTAVPLSGQESLPETRESTLELYGFPTQTGVCGRREYSDVSGRPVKVVYYMEDWESGRHASSAPASAQALSLSQPTSDPARLRVHSFETHDYDEAGREVRWSSYRPDGTLSRFATYAHFADGWLRSMKHFTVDGRMHYEIRYAAPSEQRRAEKRRLGGPLRGPSESHLYYDENSGRLAAVQGRIPDDIAATADWGGSHDGLRCAIFRYYDSSPQELRFAVVLQNVATSTRGGVLSPGGFRPILRDESRAVIPIAPGSVGARYLGVTVNPGCESPIEPERTAFCFYLALKHNYAPLPRGKYSLQVEYRGAGTEWVLSSRELRFEVP